MPNADTPETNIEETRLPRLVRLYIKQVAIGFGLSALFVGLLLGLDVAGLRTLILNTEGGAIAAFLLFFFNGLVFAGVQFAISIMRMAQPEDKGPRGGRRAPVATRTPAQVHVAAGK
jgi:hypothetical protein